MPGLLILGAVTAMLAPSAPGDKLRAYPAMRHEGAAYAVATDTKDRIVTCLPLDPATDAARARAACAAIVARGVPAGITPALSKGASDTWFPRATSRRIDPAHSSGSVTVLYEIDERGTATNCMIRHSSGIEMLDLAACAAMLKRARFTPASYQDKPVHAAAIATFEYESE